MTGADAQARRWPDRAEKEQQGATPPPTNTGQQSPPYWTFDTTTEEWVQRYRDGTEIRRAPARHRREDA